jgi:hypothetical protein
MSAGPFQLPLTPGTGAVALARNNSSGSPTRAPGTPKSPSMLLASREEALGRVIDETSKAESVKALIAELVGFSLLNPSGSPDVRQA